MTSEYSYDHSFFLPPARTLRTIINNTYEKSLVRAKSEAKETYRQLAGQGIETRISHRHIRHLEEFSAAVTAITDFRLFKAILDDCCDPRRLLNSVKTYCADRDEAPDPESFAVDLALKLKSAADQDRDIMIERAIEKRLKDIWFSDFGKTVFYKVRDWQQDQSEKISSPSPLSL
ncbi:MAG: hypothetical protein EOM26_08850 [Alphaproteobacteria bacterium]|nr:hypothetical protein [Alphaproteobacteria bacterium]